jgi:hypothetical protein
MFDIRNKLRLESLNGDKYKGNWKNHVQHMTENSIPIQMVDYQP